MIAHFDIDSFFVSVELVKDPTLAGKPVIVGGSSERGIVTSCSYEARKYGVQSAMPIKEAIRLCPDAIILKGNYADYRRYSNWVSKIISERAPLFEKASIDEFFIDLNGMDTYFDTLQWTINLKNQIHKETGLPSSFGIAKNKMLAKMATNESKPNGYLVIPDGKEKDFLSALDVAKIPGVGQQSAKVLYYHGIKTISDLYKKTKNELETLIGIWAGNLWERVQANSVSVISAIHEAKSISTENTFETDIVNTSSLEREIVRMTEKIAFELRKSEKLATCISIKIRYKNFETTSRQVTVPPTCADDEMIPIAKALFNKLYQKDRPVRLLGVRLSALVTLLLQADLFQDFRKKNTLYKAIDGVKDRFGKESIFRAAGKLHSGDNNVV